MIIHGKKFVFLFFLKRGFHIGKVIEILHREYLDNIKIMNPMQKPLYS